MVTYKMAEKSGIDCISVTQGWQESSIPVITRDIPQGTWLYNAKRAKQAVKIPVSMAYRLFLPEIPNKAIADGILDIWENCRPQIADPHMPKAVLEGREEDIRPCVACNLCLARLFRDAPMTCYVNPVCAHEWDPNWQITPAETKKKVMVIGAGPAGLECAWVAAKRGHEVHVYEKSAQIGGQLLDARHAPYGDEELFGITKFQEAQCKKAGVSMHMNTTVTPQLIEEDMPDAVVIATGAKFRPEKVPGHDGPNVVSALDVLSGRADVGGKAIVWGGKKPGIAVALFLAEKGKKVTLLSHERKVGKDVNPSYIWRYIQKLSQKGVKVYKDCAIEEIDGHHVIIRAPHGVRIPTTADTIIYAEREPVKDLEDAVKAANIELHLIGDALVPRTMSNALHDGYRTGIRV
jgi:2,4-dienoyl-CoA reductase (NADPH2)